MKRQIGQTGIEVTAIGLGAMPLSIQGRPSEDQGHKVIYAAMEAGVTFIDTANAYCHDENDVGHNERLISTALRQRQHGAQITVATKGGCIRPGGDWGVDGRPEALRVACEKSLVDLNVSQITLYHWHTPDFSVPFEASVKMLKVLKEGGMITHIGLSNVDQLQLEAALNIVRIEAIQNRLNPFCKRDLRSGLVDFCRQRSITYIAYSPVGGHFQHTKAADHPLFKELAQKHGKTPFAIMLAWALKSGSNILPIPGASRVESIVDSVRAMDVELTADDVKRIDDLPDSL